MNLGVETQDPAERLYGQSAVEGPGVSHSGGPAEDSEDEDFGGLLCQGRQQILKENPDAPSITVQMLEDWYNRKFWGLMQAARKRVRGYSHKETKNMQER